MLDAQLQSEVVPPDRRSAIRFDVAECPDVADTFEQGLAFLWAYADHGLVFAKEWSDVQQRGECLGQPLQINNMGSGNTPS